MLLYPGTLLSSHRTPLKAIAYGLVREFERWTEPYREQTEAVNVGIAGLHMIEPH